MTMYYVYEKATGLFAGSGTPFFDDAVHGCVTVPNPVYDYKTQQCNWTGQEWVLTFLLSSVP
jgi:hypothetical protein